MMGDLTYFKAVDTRSRIYTWIGRLLNAINIPNATDTEMPLNERQDNLKLLSRNIILVFYDQGEETTAADLAQQLVDLNEELDLGFNVEDIRILEGGFDRLLKLSYPITGLGNG